MRRTAIAAAAAAASLALAAGALAGAASTKLSLVAYSTPKEAYAKLIPAFQATAAGKDVSVEQSYGASGEQARAVIAGLHADVVEFSLAPDLDDLVAKGLVARSWTANAHGGMVTRSVVVFVLRNGNPKHIRTWDDLLKPGVQVVTPNPFTSGGARWNVMAAYGAQLRAGRTHAQAVSYLRRLFKHVVAQDKSARESLQTFLSGRGDALLAYENEAKLAQSKGQPVFYAIPKATILIENPIAVTKGAPAAAKAFVNFLYTAKAQQIFAENGYRPVVQSVARKFASSFPKRPQLFTIDYVGGWPKVQKRFFDPRSGIMATIERGLGG
jgi:sulfate transport system substrate-binding protein